MAQRRSSMPCWRASRSPSPMASMCSPRRARAPPRPFLFGGGAPAGGGPRPPGRLGGGGGPRPGFGAQTTSDVTGLTVELAPGAEAGAALGAARLGMLAAGAGDEKSICARPPVQREFLPDAARAALHAPRLRRYRALYGAEKAAR